MPRHYVTTRHDTQKYDAVAELNMITLPILDRAVLLTAVPMQHFILHYFAIPLPNQTWWDNTVPLLNSTWQYRTKQSRRETRRYALHITVAEPRVTAHNCTMAMQRITRLDFTVALRHLTRLHVTITPRHLTLPYVTSPLHNLTRQNYTVTAPNTVIHHRCKTVLNSTARCNAIAIHDQTPSNFTLPLWNDVKLRPTVPKLYWAMLRKTYLRHCLTEL